MAVTREKFTSGADGDAITAANTGATTVLATGGTAVIDTDVVYSATRSVLAIATSTSGVVYWSKTISSTTTCSMDMYIRITALPSAEQGILYMGAGATRNVSLNVTLTGALRIRDGANAAIYTSTAVMSLNTWYRVSMFATQNASTGTVRTAFYAGNSSTPIEDSTLLTARNTGSGAFTQLRWGTKVGTGTTTLPANLDDYAYDPVGTGLLAPEAPPDPVLPSDPQTIAYRVFLDLSATVAAVGPLVFSATPSSGVVATSTGLFLPVNADGSVTTYTVTATDTGAGNTTDTLTYDARLPSDIIETVMWSGSVWG